MTKTMRLLSALTILILLLLPAAVQAAGYSGILYYFTSKYGNYGSYTGLDLSTMLEDPLGLRGDDWTVTTNGRHLVYRGKQYKYHAYDLQTRTDKELPSEWAYNSSPASVSAHLFGFIRQENMKCLIYLKSVLDGTERRMPHSLPEGVRYTADLAFIPPLGKATPFIIASGNTLYRVDTNATTVIYKTPSKADNVRYPSVSPDGSRVTFVTDLKPGLWLINLDGSGLTRLLEGDCQYTAWSPDGNYIAFTSVNGAVRGNLYQDSVSGKTFRGAGGFTHKVWIVGLNGTDPQPIPGPDGKGVSVMGRVLWR